MDLLSTSLKPHHVKILTPHEIEALEKELLAGVRPETAAQARGYAPNLLADKLRVYAGDRKRLHMAIFQARAELEKRLFAASKDSRWWQSAVTYLERIYNEEWGKKFEDSHERVVVNVGVKIDGRGNVMTTGRRVESAKLLPPPLPVMFPGANPAERRVKARKAVKKRERDHYRKVGRFKWERVAEGEVASVDEERDSAPVALSEER